MICSLMADLFLSFIVPCLISEWFLVCSIDFYYDEAWDCVLSIVLDVPLQSGIMYWFAYCLALLFWFAYKSSPMNLNIYDESLLVLETIRYAFIAIHILKLATDFWPIECIWLCIWFSEKSDYSDKLETYNILHL